VSRIHVQLKALRSSALLNIRLRVAPLAHFGKKVESKRWMVINTHAPRDDGIGVCLEKWVKGYSVGIIKRIAWSAGPGG
jgi:hypothetical protein